MNESRSDLARGVERHRNVGPDLAREPDALLEGQPRRLRGTIDEEHVERA
jgi:hypothetical protein